jgi:hypothetical protein
MAGLRCAVYVTDGQQTTPVPAIKGVSVPLQGGAIGNVYGTVQLPSTCQPEVPPERSSTSM